TRSGSTTTHAENSLPEYDSFHFEIESNQGELSKAVMETIDEIDAFLDINVSTDLKDGYHDSEGDIIYLESLLIDNTIPNLSPEVLFDHEQKCLKDEPNNLISTDIKEMDKRKDKTDTNKHEIGKSKRIPDMSDALGMTRWRSSSLPLVVARGTRSNGQDLKFRSGYEWRVEIRELRSVPGSRIISSWL
ncbi:hypothetical protein Tco_0613261, partial [Tanacetum coccineum]